MNRQARRKAERDRVKSSTTRSMLRPTDFTAENAAFPPEPGPVGTQLGKYKYGGRTWVLITVNQPNNTTNVLFAPEDASRFAADIIKVVAGLKLTEDKESPVAEPATLDSGLVIAKELPHE